MLQTPTFMGKIKSFKKTPDTITFSFHDLSFERVFHKNDYDMASGMQKPFLALEINLLKHAGIWQEKNDALGLQERGSLFLKLLDKTFDDFQKRYELE
jgi:hypothetical protein